MLIVRAVHSTSPRDVRSRSQCTEMYHFYSVLEVITAGFQERTCVLFWY